MNYKLIASDIDGTLIDKSNGIIDTNTVRLVKEFQEKGGYFTIATGRMEAAIIPFVEALGINCPVIAYNGSKVINVRTNEIIYEEKVEKSIAIIALKLATKYNLDALVYINQNAYINKQTKSIVAYEKKEKVKCIKVNNLVEFLDQDPTKILFIGEPDNFYKFMAEVRFETNKNINFINSEPTYLELLKTDVSKGSALKVLADYLNIPMNQIIAIGDERNDITMITAAGFGVAVYNAKEELKDVADYVSKFESFSAVNEVLIKAINNLGG